MHLDLVLHCCQSSLFQIILILLFLFFFFFSPIGTKWFTKDNNSRINSRISLFKSDTPELIHKPRQSSELSVLGVHGFCQHLTPHTPKLQLWLGLTQWVYQSMNHCLLLAILALCRDPASQQAVWNCLNNSLWTMSGRWMQVLQLQQYAGTVIIISWGFEQHNNSL